MNDTKMIDPFVNRLRKNFGHIGRWARQQNITNYRVYDRDLPEFSLVIDLYHGTHTWVMVQEFQAPNRIDPLVSKARLTEALQVIPEIFDTDKENIFLKVRQRQRGLAQYEKLSHQKTFHIVKEVSCQFYVNFTDYLDTGLFLDHRITRNIIHASAEGKRFLNLFAYTGTATVFAALGKASTTTTVDLSKTYLDWAERNLKLNKINIGSDHQLIQRDCLAWIKEAISKQWQYDLVFIDPPSFSNSKRMQNTFDVQRDHEVILRQISKLLSSKGVVFFSNNRRGFAFNHAVLKQYYKIHDITKQTIPKDFVRNQQVHACWKMEKLTK